MKNIKFPTRFVTARNMLIVTAVYIVFPLFFLPRALRSLQEASGKTDYVPLDLRPGFTSDQAWQALDLLGTDGREVYWFSQMTMEVIYPLAYGLFFAFVLVFLFSQAGGMFVRMTAVAWVPLVGSVFDWFENIGIIKLIGAFPERADGWAQFASVSGQAKWLFSGITLLYVMAALAVWGWRLIKNPVTK